MSETIGIAIILSILLGVFLVAWYHWMIEKINEAAKLYIQQKRQSKTM